MQGFPCHHGGASREQAFKTSFWEQWSTRKAKRNLSSFKSDGAVYYNGVVCYNGDSQIKD